MQTDIEAFLVGEFEVGHSEHLCETADVIQWRAYFVRHALYEGSLGFGGCFGTVALNGKLLILCYHQVAFALQLLVLDFQLAAPTAVVNQENENSADTHNHGNAARGEPRALFELLVGCLQFADGILPVQMVEAVALVDDGERIFQ